jgi:hypothetical protein
MIFEKECQINTYAHLWGTALGLHRLSKSCPEKDKKHLFKACLVFIAFSFEAFINHIGYIFIKPFNSFESLKHFEKIENLSNLLNFNVDYSKRPWQTVKFISIIRNSIVHGKTYFTEFERNIFVKDFKSFLEIGDRLSRHPVLTDWQKNCTENNIDKSFKDIRSIFLIIANKAGIEDDLFIGGFSSSGISHEKSF